MSSTRAGEPVSRTELVDIPGLVTRYFTERPNPEQPAERVSFGTSGHRGTSLRTSFNEDHIVAICAALAEHRRHEGVGGPLLIGRDTHALSEPAFVTAVETLAAHDVAIILDSGSRFTPTPVISHAILAHNRNRTTGLADGIVITPSHNPPEDGGFKYNPPNGGPADTAITAAVQARANELLESGVDRIPRLDFRKALQSAARRDLAAAYVTDLDTVLDMDVVAGSGISIGVDPMGGAAIDYWDRIAQRWGVKLDVVNRAVDPTFAFMTADWDGRVRMDCSSPHAMAGLIRLKDRYDHAFGNDPDVDRHGVVTPSAGLLDPNHYLAVAIWHLFRNRPDWAAGAGIGKTLVSSSMIDRVAAHLGRTLVEVPVGFKWFVDGLLSGTLAFGGEESAGASFVRRDGSVWTTDKDGIILGLLGAEIRATTGRDPGEIHSHLERQFGAPVYQRIDAAATAAEKKALQSLSADAVTARTLAGEPIVARLTHAPGNGAAIGGLKVVTENGWFAARPSGTEDVYKIYAESFIDEQHLRRIQSEARDIVGAALRGATA